MLAAALTCAGLTVFPSSRSGYGHVAHAQSGILRIADEGVRDVEGLDPIATQGYDDYLPITLMFSGLVKLTPQQTIAPDLAQSWTISGGGTVYTFHLRPHLQFSNGDPITAADFVYSITRSYDAKNPLAEGISFLGDIQGARAYWLGKATSVSGLRAVDPLTLQITLAAPRSYFLGELTWTTGFVVDQAVVRQYGHSWTEHAAGTGPFMLKQWIHNQRLVLVPNPHWLGGKVQISEVDIPFIVGTDAAYTAYQTDEIDVAGVGLGGVPSFLFDQNPPQPDLHVATGGVINLLGFSERNIAFADIRVRHAFALALDRQAIARAMNNSVIPSEHFLWKGMVGFNPALKALSFDPAAARAALASAGYRTPSNPTGKPFPSVSLTFTAGSSDVRREAEALQLLWKLVLGVDVKLDPVSITVQEQRDIKGTFDLIMGTMATVYPSPRSILFIFEGIYSFWKNSQTFDSLMQQADSTQDPARSIRLYQQAEQYLVDQTPQAPLNVLKQGLLIKSRVHGLSATPFGVSAADWSQVTVQ